MSLTDSIRSLAKELPHSLRQLGARVTDLETPARYKYIFRPEVEDAFAFIAGLVGAFSLLLPGGQGFGLAALAVAGAITAVRYPSPSKRAAQEITDTAASGQELTGTRRDLFKLHRAQLQVDALTKPFNSATALPEAVTKRINALAADTAAERARIKTNDGKPFQYTRKRVVTTTEPVA